MFSSKKPYSAVTVAIENFTSESYEDDDVSGIPDLVEAIKLQSTGPAEAARAIRKKLKYGNVHRQIRALVILDGLIQNAGPRFQRTFADEMLLERLRVCGTSNLSDPLVKDKCKELFRQWAAEYKNTRGLEQIAGLYKQLPRRKQVVTQDKSKVLRETEQNPFEGDEEEDVPSPPKHGQPSHSRNQPSFTIKTPPSSSLSPDGFSDALLKLRKEQKEAEKKAKKDKKSKKGGKAKPFDLEAEKVAMKANIGEAGVASINLLNALRRINRETERISENKEAVHQFEYCKLLRRKILRYIQHVESEQWLGALLHANDELVTALMTFEQLDRSIDADSDSDDELAAQQHMYKIMTDKGKENAHSPASPSSATRQLAGLTLSPKAPGPEQRPPQPPRPPRPAQPAPPPAEESDDDFEEEDENDPFADRNAVTTPHVEKPEPRWTEI